MLDASAAIRQQHQLHVRGALLPGRARSSFVFEPDWPARPWPPRDKYGHAANDAELGLA